MRTCPLLADGLTPMRAHTTPSRSLAPVRAPGGWLSRPVLWPFFSCSGRRLLMRVCSPCCVNKGARSSWRDYRGHCITHPSVAWSSVGR